MEFGEDLNLTYDTSECSKLITPTSRKARGKKVKVVRHVAVWEGKLIFARVFRRPCSLSHLDEEGLCVS